VNKQSDSISLDQNL